MWGRWQLWAGCLYVAAALALAGWTVNLGRSLNPTAVAHHLPEVKAAVAALLIILSAGLTALHHDSRKPSGPRPVVQMLKLAIVTVCITIEWFFVLPRTASTWGDIAFVVAVALVGLSTAVSFRSRRRVLRTQTGRVVCLGLLAASAVVMVASSPATVIGVRQPLVWVGLDVAELLSLAAIGLLLMTHRSALIPATVAACLFLCDAVINIGVARGHALALALAMACIELPLAALSAWLGLRSARRLPIRTVGS